MEDIVKIAAGYNRFTVLVTAVKVANPIETVKGKGPFTSSRLANKGENECI